MMKGKNGAHLLLSYTGPRHELIYELELVTDQSRYLLNDNLARFSRADLTPSDRYKNYREYRSTDTSEHWSNPERFVHFLRQLHEDLSSGTPRYHNVEAAIQTQPFAKTCCIRSRRGRTCRRSC